MKKIIVSMVVFLASLGVGKAQYSFYFNDNIPVIVNGDTLTIPWAGGMNNPQFSTIDLNGDGLQDLFVFDRDGNKVITFINTGAPNAVSYRYAPEYQAKFPTNMTNWALLADYNCDGKQDIYTYNSTGTGGGMTLYRNDYSSMNGLQFSLIATTVMTVWGTQHENLYVSPVNLPTILDMDGDGMVDVLSFSPLGNIIYFHRNVAIDDGKTCDSVDFKTLVSCWGNCGTNPNANYFTLNLACRLNEHDSALNSSGWMKHSGGCLCGLDLNGDGAKDMLVGDIVSNTTDALYNGGTSQYANITTQDSTFPSTNVSINIPAFPCCYHVDVDNDGKRDLICAPNAAGVSENTHGIWYYKNFGTDANPIFHYQTDSFMQGKMIEVGQNSMPVLFDYDNDGLKDLVIGNYGYYTSSGTYRSGLSLFRNTGTSSHPAFTLMTQDWANINSLHVNAVKPTFGDIYGTGKKDMIVGIDSGYLLYFPDTAAIGFPASYGVPTIRYQNISIGNNNYAAPQLIDVNRDGLLDLIIGDIYGKISYYQNTGSATNPVFALQTSNFGGVNVKEHGYLTGYSQPFMFDSAGSYKLMVGSERGYIYYYNNIDGNLAGTFNLVDSMFNYHSMFGFDGTRVSVCGADIDGDGKMDLITGNQLGGVNLYVSTNQTGTNFPRYNNPKISVYPNPSGNIVTINIIGQNVFMNSLYVYDILGQEVMHKALGNQETSTNMDVSNLANGVYFCKVNLNSQQTLVEKILVKH